MQKGQVFTNSIFGFLVWFFVLNCYKSLFTSINSDKLRAIMDNLNTILNLNRVGPIDQPTQDCMNIVMS